MCGTVRGVRGSCREQDRGRAGVPMMWLVLYIYFVVMLALAVHIYG